MGSPAVSTALHNHFKDIRARLELTQSALAEKLGVTARTINRWETGASDVPDSVLPQALSLLRAQDPEAADELAVRVGLPAAREQERARRAALDHAVFVVADDLDISPRRARDAMLRFLDHLLAAGMTARDARARLADKQNEQNIVDEASRAAAHRGLMAVEARRRYRRSRVAAARAAWSEPDEP